MEKVYKRIERCNGCLFDTESYPCWCRRVDKSIKEPDTFGGSVVCYGEKVFRKEAVGLNARLRGQRQIRDG